MSVGIEPRSALLPPPRSIVTAALSLLCGCSPVARGGWHPVSATAHETTSTGKTQRPVAVVAGLQERVSLIFKRGEKSLGHFISVFLQSNDRRRTHFWARSHSLASGCRPSVKLS